jgi:hypothetical protein
MKPRLQLFSRVSRKSIYAILLLLLILPHSRGSDTLSIEDFNKMNPTDREKAIEQAVPEQRDKLRKLDLHIKLLVHWRGEDGLKIAKETQAAKVRGLGDLTTLFKGQTQVWDDYVGGVLWANMQAGMSREAQIAVEDRMSAEKNAIRARLPMVHSLIFNMAASPEALELDKRAAKLAKQLWTRMSSEHKVPFHAITREEVMDVDLQVDQILEEMKKLPQLKREQAQREVDVITDDKVREQGFIRPLYLPPLAPGQFGGGGER